MEIIWNPNPLKSVIVLTEDEKKQFILRRRIEDIIEDVGYAHYLLKNEKVDQQKIEALLQAAMHVYEEPLPDDDDYLPHLAERHMGDCVCVACSCSKCHAEDLLGVSTIEGLGKHAAHKIEVAFDKEGATLDSVIEGLATYKVGPRPETWPKGIGYEQYVPKWEADAKAAHRWLVAYRDKHFAKEDV